MHPVIHGYWGDIWWDTVTLTTTLQTQPYTVGTLSTCGDGRQCQADTADQQETQEDQRYYFHADLLGYVIDTKTLQVVVSCKLYGLLTFFDDHIFTK